MRHFLAALLLFFGLSGPAVADCPLRSMTPPQIGAALRAARDNIVQTIAEIEKPGTDEDKRRVLVMRLKRNRDLIDRILGCQEFH